MSDTKIEWTDTTWNPTTGCDRVSPGCDNCYALTMAKRLKGMGSAKYQRDGDPRTSGPGFGITEHPDTLAAPFSWRKPRKVFVNSMSDLFHDGVSDEFIARLWAVMAATPQHTYQILTKRHGRMRSLLGAAWFPELVTTWAWRDGVRPDGPMVDLPAPNVWLGVSVEDQKRADLRIPALLQTPATVRFLSCEPLLGPVDLLQSVNKLDWLDEANWKPGGIDWVIVGGESGPGARPMHPDWARQLRDQCSSAGVSFHFKQWGAWAPAWRSPSLGDVWVHPDGTTHEWNPGDGHTRSGGGDFRGAHDSALMRHGVKDVTGRDLDGRTWDEFPTETGDQS